MSINAVGFAAVELEAAELHVPLGLDCKLCLHWSLLSGLNSKWFPYIYLLPEEPPCAWMWTASNIESYFSRLPPKIQESCEKFLRPARIQKETLYSEVDFALEEFGDALPIEAEDLLWSIAQVQSRAYSAGRTDEGVALTPVVDLLNHSGNAMPPVG